MYFMADGREVIVIVCVLVLAGHAQKACDISMPDSISLTVNCSRRDIRDVPDAWPKETEFIEKDGYVLITFFNNSITDVTQLAGVAGSRVAISFQANKIVDIVDDAFQNIPTLVYLDVSYNQLSGDVLRSEIFQGPYENGVYGYIALETLNLGYNKIHSLDRYLFQHTPNLTRLYLNNNPIEILDHVTLLALSTATNLEVLDLASTDIESIPLDAFKSLSNLQQIDLSGNGFLTVPESLSFVGRTLKYLTFNNNPIAELNDDSFVGLANLIELEVGENENLEEVKRSTFTPLKSLKVLHLCHNANLRYISHNAFRGLKDKWTLKEVYLDDNHLSELSTDLMPWNKLDILGMSGNKWLCNCELYNIVSKQGAGTKFKSGDEPFCAAPMKLSGEYVTNVTLSYCPSFDTTFAKTKQHSRFKPKHVLWTILGVSMVVCVGMLIGLFVNTVKKYYKKKFIQPIRYANINEDSMFP